MVCDLLFEWLCNYMVCKLLKFIWHYKLCYLLESVWHYELCGLFMKYADWLHGLLVVVLNANFSYFYHFHPYPSPCLGKCCHLKKRLKIALCGRIALFYLYMLDFQQTTACSLKIDDLKSKNQWFDFGLYTRALDIVRFFVDIIHFTISPIIKNHIISLSKS